MKRKLVLFTIFPTLLLSALWIGARLRKQHPAYILSHYPPSPAFDRTRDYYLRPDADTRYAVFSESWFRHRQDTMAMQCNIYQGANRVCRSGTSFNALNSTQILTAPQLAAIEAVTLEMPPSQNTPLPTLDDLLIVGFWQDGQWITRIYDRANLPPQVAKVHRILATRGFDKTPTSASK